MNIPSPSGLSTHEVLDTHDFWLSLYRKAREALPEVVVKQAYTERFPISKAKYKDLEKLCNQNIIKAQ